MSKSLQSLIQAGTKLWLDSIDPELIKENFEFGATGATSNPIIVADLIKTGRFDDEIAQRIQDGMEDSVIAWSMTDKLVSDAQTVFQPVWNSTDGNNGYVSFELDPLLEDIEANFPHEYRVENYVELAKKWSEGYSNRMIKVPATPAGLDALEDIAAAGIPLNVTLIFTDDQYEKARDAVWRGAQKLGDLSKFKSVYSIFVSRIDVYTSKTNSDLSEEAQGEVGILNAKRIWELNQKFWADKGCPLEQEIIFASTGTKKPEDPAWKYVQALAGSDIQTNPPKTNQAVADNDLEFSRQVDVYPGANVVTEIDQKVDFNHMFETLMSEGLAKFAQPQKELISLIGEKRAALAEA
ncbi:MAG: transaldolase family protein [Planctomycetota bacterium]